FTVIYKERGIIMSDEYNPNEINQQGFNIPVTSISDFDNELEDTQSSSISGTVSSSSFYSEGNEENLPNKYASIDSSNPPEEDNNEDDADTFSIEPKAEKNNSIPLWLKIALPLVGIIIASLAVVLVTGLLSSKGSMESWQTIVPNILKVDYAEANKTVESASLHAIISDKKSSAGIPENAVLSQSLNGDEVVGKGNVVKVVLSAGKEEITLPDLQYYTADYAKQVLTAKGLEVNVQTVSSDNSETVAPGSVILSDPSPNATVASGSKVYLCIKEDNMGKTDNSKKVAIPNLVGEDFVSVAQSYAQKKVYLAINGTTPGSDEQKGKIMSQDIVADKEVPEGTVINVVVCSGSGANKVPDVTYRKLETAKALLEANGITPVVRYEESDKVAKGTVIKQDIEAGASTKTNSTVTIIVSSGKIISTPDVQGKTIDNAVNALVDSMLAVNVVYKVDKSVKLGTVIDQDYKAGSDVQLGTVVTITVSGKKAKGEVLSTTLLDNEKNVEEEPVTTTEETTSETTTEESTTETTTEKETTTKSTTKTTKKTNTPKETTTAKSKTSKETTTAKPIEPTTNAPIETTSPPVTVTQEGTDY
ncbi:MAG: PASTA domain-containing protein, partial [Ruminococcus sp.]|nr:PASTA domain-containing protein [Candidatus Copronaster equi]